MEQKITFSRQELHWHIIKEYLVTLSSFGIVYRDEIFGKKLKDLQNYVDKKLELQSDGDIIDLFVLVLQQSNE